MVKRTTVGNHLIDPTRIRALATGVGQTQQRSKDSGDCRAAKVVAAMPPGVASKAIGYPAADPMTALYKEFPGKDAPLPVDGSVG